MSPEISGIMPSDEAQPKTEDLRKGRLVRYLRIQRGIKQELLADEATISSGYLSNIESGEIKNIGCIKTINLAKALGIGIHFWENGLEDTKVFVCFQAKTVENIMNSEAPESLKSALRQYIETLPDPPPSGMTYIDHFPIQQTLSDKLIIKFDERGIPQHEIKRSTGLSQGYISQLMTNPKGEVVDPPFGTIVKLAEALNIDIYDFLDIEEIAPPDWLIKVDAFFRSETVSPETKKRAWQIISLMLDQARDQFFYAPQPQPETQL